MTGHLVRMALSAIPAVGFLLAKYALALPLLHRLPWLGAPYLEPVIGLVGGSVTRDGDAVLGIAFVNAGPRRVANAIITVGVDDNAGIRGIESHSGPRLRWHQDQRGRHDGSSVSADLHAKTAAALYYQLKVRDKSPETLSVYVTCRVRPFGPTRVWTVHGLAVGAMRRAYAPMDGIPEEDGRAVSAEM